MNRSDEHTTMFINNTSSREGYYANTAYNYTAEDSDDIDLLFNYETVATVMIGGICAILVAYIYNYVASKRQNKVYDSLNKKHIMMSILHACLWALLEYSKNGHIACNTLAGELLCSLELAIPFWTLCISLKMFSDLYLFTSQDVFSVKDMTFFTCTSVTVMNNYELLIIFLTDDGVGGGLNFASAVRVTCVLLITSISVTTFCIIIVSFRTNSDIVKPLGLFFLLHLFVFIFCDLCLALFIMAKTTSWSDSLVYVSSQLVYYRMLLEVIWYVFSHFLGKWMRIYNNEN